MVLVPYLLSIQRGVMKHCSKKLAASLLQSSSTSPTTNTFQIYSVSKFFIIEKIKSIHVSFDSFPFKGPTTIKLRSVIISSKLLYKVFH